MRCTLPEKVSLPLASDVKLVIGPGSTWMTSWPNSTDQRLGPRSCSWCSISNPSWRPCPGRKHSSGTRSPGAAGTSTSRRTQWHWPGRSCGSSASSSRSSLSGRREEGITPLAPTMLGPAGLGNEHWPAPTPLSSAALPGPAQPAGDYVLNPCKPVAPLPGLCHD